MIDTLIKSIEDTFVQFTFRRLLYVLFLLALVCGALYVFDQSTGYTFYSRLDKRIEALEKLQAIESRGFRQSSDLDSIYQSIIVELRDHPPSPLRLHIGTDPFVKFFAAALVPFVFIIVGVFKMVRREPDGSTLFAGALAFTLILGLPAIFIPTMSSIWLNVATYGIVQAVVVIALTRLGRKKPAS